MEQGCPLDPAIADLEDLRLSILRDQWAQVAGLFDVAGPHDLPDEALEARAAESFDAYWESAGYEQIEAYDRGQGMIGGLTLAIDRLRRAAA